MGTSKLSSGVLLESLLMPWRLRLRGAPAGGGRCVIAAPASGREVVVMVATSYPRFPGDTIGTFMEPIARGVAARGHEVHMVLPWHPRWRRGRDEHGVQFHLFRYAPTAGLYVFGYAGALRADVNMRLSAYAVAPLALAAGWREARRGRARGTAPRSSTGTG